MPLRTHRRLATLVLAVLPAAAGCGDDATATAGSGGSGGSTQTSSPSSTSGTTGGGGPGSSGGGEGGSGPASSASSSGQGAGGAGEGGGGGPSWEGVDPLAGAQPVQLVAGGFDFTEGPLWLDDLQVLRFSDIPPREIHQVAGDEVTLWRQDSGGSNGLALMPAGRMLACEGAARRVTTSPTDAPDFTLLVDRFEGDRFNAPNDAIVRDDGTIYFTDPDYGLDPQDHEIGFNGVYRIDLQGAVHLVDDGRDLPNGIALSPDQETLYVADNGSSELWTYAIAPDGSTSEGAVLTATAAGPDGLAVDDGGNLYVTTLDGIDVRRPDGTAWGVLPVPETPANCTFGGNGRRTLFITARTSLYRVDLVIPGLP